MIITNEFFLNFHIFLAPASPSLCEFFSEVESMKESASAIEPSSKETDVVESIQDGDLSVF